MPSPTTCTDARTHPRVLFSLCGKGFPVWKAMDSFASKRQAPPAKGRAFLFETVVYSAFGADVPSGERPGVPAFRGYCRTVFTFFSQVSRQCCQSG